MSNSSITIEELFKEAGKQLRSDFEFIKNSNPHFSERGTEAEVILIDFLNNHLPKRFHATTGLIVDNHNNISRQIDVIIYDAFNSPVYRKGPKTAIIPYDNVACVIEVKSSLSKNELEDAALKISSVKKLKKTPIAGLDQPVTFSEFINVNTFGIVFAYESKTKLETLGSNLVEVNSKYPAAEWINSVVVLDKGLLEYSIQMPFEKGFPGNYGGSASEDFIIPPFYIHLVKADLGELTLNKFFIHLMAHLTFYRKISSVNFRSLIKDDTAVMTLNAYQYNLKRELKPVEEIHKEGKLLPNIIRYNIYEKSSRKYLGQVIWVPWQDGSFVGYSGFLRPEIVIGWFAKSVKGNISILKGMKDVRFWMTNIIPLNMKEFENTCNGIKNNFQVERDSNDERMPWDI